MYRVLGAFIALLVTAGCANAQSLPPAATTSPLIAAPVVQLQPHIPTEVLSQSDPRWKYERLGNGTIWTQGCLIMNLVQIAFEQGLGSDPEQILQSLLTPKLVTRSGMLKTQMLDTIFPSIRVLERFSIGRGYDLSTVISTKLMEGFVLLELAHDGHSHWVRAIAIDNGNIMIADPAGGRVGPLRELYKVNRVLQIVVIGGGGNAS